MDYEGTHANEAEARLPSGFAWLALLRWSVFRVFMYVLFLREIIEIDSHCLPFSGGWFFVFSVSLTRSLILLIIVVPMVWRVSAN